MKIAFFFFFFISVISSFYVNPQHVGGNQEASSFIHSLRMCCALMTGSPLKYVTFSQHLQISHCFHRFHAMTNCMFMYIVLIIFRNKTKLKYTESSLSLVLFYYPFQATNLVHLPPEHLVGQER